MLDWSKIDLLAAGQGLVYLVLAALAACGLMKRKAGDSAKPESKSQNVMQLDGALVDSTSVKQLAAAVKAVNITIMTIHRDSETVGKARVAALQAMVEVIGDLAANVHQTNVLTEREEEERERRDRERLIHENEQLQRDLKEAQRRAGEAAMRRD
ncbi:hypothetical protein [Jiella pelagia]|uniref:Uncharacterized protein n=1 Tax=Jiella pelagia TaxID=2986949 RepID=A0ABY7BXJ9_9HYPH|nr:hypothetical protein [Jiella pelagia]WAP67243.1 hypothetical protein OH818_16840 [Jiella pelagia]